MDHNQKRTVSLDQLRKEVATEKSIAKKLEESGTGSTGSSHTQKQPQTHKQQQQHQQPQPSPEHHHKALETVTHTGGGANRGGLADRKSFSIVWAPLPVASWIFPLIGHTGITNSHGVIYDFSDDFNVSVNNFPFGEPTKYYQFDPMLISPGDSLAAKTIAWDRAILGASASYGKTRHSLCFNNCHQYIAYVLNELNYANNTNWNQRHVWRLITFHSKYTSWLGFVRQWWPFTAIVATLIAIGCFLLW